MTPQTLALLDSFSWRSLSANPARAAVAVLAAAALLCPLLAFGWVVQDVVRKADGRRVAVAGRAEALWRCNVLKAEGKRECIQRLPPMRQLASAAPAAPAGR